MASLIQDPSVKLQTSDERFSIFTFILCCGFITF